MIYLENNELYHHGVKGQKWGVIRKHLRSVGRATSAGGHATAKAAIRGKKYVEKIIAKHKEKKDSIKESTKNTKRKDPSKMTDAELRTASARLQLENTYINAYNNRYPKRQSKVDKFVDGALEKLGRAGVSKMEQYLTKDIPGYQPYTPESWKNDNKKKNKKKKGKN